MAIKKRARTFAEFKEWVESLTSVGGEMLYRGLSSTKYDLSSSIARRIKYTMKEEGKEDKELENSDIWKATFALIEDTKKQGYDRAPTRRGESPTTDFEILALLQHHDAATPLMDFSHNPFIALWFACQGDSKKGCKIIAVDPNNLEKIPTEINNEININTDSITRNGIKRIDENGKGKLLTQDNNLWRFNPPGFDARILTQNSEFILGQKGLEEGDAISTCIISRNTKNDIQQKLKDFYGISEERIFRDFSGYTDLNSPTSLIKNLDEILTDKEPTEQQESKKFSPFIKKFPLPFPDDPKS